MKGDGGEEAVMMQGGLGYVAELGVTAAAGVFRKSQKMMELRQNRRSGGSEG